MKIFYNRFIPWGNFSAINLFGVLFVRYGQAVYNHTIRHESIHTAQMKELLYLPFYLLYVLEWLVRLVQYRFRWTQAYLNISFEQEAYAHQHDDTYLQRRLPYASFRSPKQDEPPASGEQ